MILWTRPKKGGKYKPINVTHSTQSQTDQLNYGGDHSMNGVDHPMEWWLHRVLSSLFNTITINRKVTSQQPVRYVTRGNQHVCMYNADPTLSYIVDLARRIHYTPKDYHQPVGGKYIGHHRPLPPPNHLLHSGGEKQVVKQVVPSTRTTGGPIRHTDSSENGKDS